MYLVRMVKRAVQCFRQGVMLFGLHNHDTILGRLLIVCSGREAARLVVFCAGYPKSLQRCNDLLRLMHTLPQTRGTNWSKIICSAPCLLCLVRAVCSAPAATDTLEGLCNP